MKPTLTLSEGRSPNLKVVITDWETLPLMLTVEEAARVIRCGEDAIREAVAMGQLELTRYGKRTVRIARCQLQAYSEKRKLEPIAVPFRDIA